jgi:polyisoprenoid-binding protein YceI
MVTVPIDQLKTGIDLRDEHLRSADWMNVEQFPTAEFKLTGISSPSSKELKDKEKITAQLTGDLTIHGVTKTVMVPGELIYLKETERTKKRLEGNLLRGSTSFTIKLSDYGISIPDMVVGKLSEEVEITVDFVSSDAM